MAGQNCSNMPWLEITSVGIGEINAVLMSQQIWTSRDTVYRLECVKSTLYLWWSCTASCCEVWVVFESEKTIVVWQRWWWWWWWCWRRLWPASESVLSVVHQL